tara:strand:- start:7263 stop:7781 length:519 start_codon:yes stop_codon:yes gene_type:complete
MERGIAKFQGADVAKAIDLYYTRFVDNESNIIYTDNSIELVNIELLEVTNFINDIPQLRWGQDFKLKMNFNLLRSLDNLMFLITIVDKEQRPVAIFDNNKDDSGINITDNQVEFNLIHNDIQLSKGVYSLNVWVGKLESTEPYLRINGVLHFQILHEMDVWPPFLLKSHFTN